MKFLRRLLIASAAALVGAGGIAGTAAAYFSSSGTGTGSAAVATLPAPADVSAAQPNASVPTLRISWAAPSGPIDGYFVQRFTGSNGAPQAACGSAATAPLPAGATHCDDAGLSAEASYTYRVVAVYRSWTAASAASAAVTVVTPTLTTFSLTPSTSTPVAGTPFTVTLTARDQTGNPATGYSGPVCLTFTGPAAAPDGTPPAYPAAGNCAAGSSVTFLNGTATAAVTLYKAAGTTLTATDVQSGKSGSTSVTVIPGQAAEFLLSAATTTPVAGTPDPLSITTVDAFLNVVPDYSGTHNLVFGGAAAMGHFSPTVTDASGTAIAFGSPTAVNFSNGASDPTGSLMTLYKSGPASITVTDSHISNASALGVNVRPAGAGSLALTADAGTVLAGSTDNLTVTALDSYGNTATSYTGAHSLIFAGAGVIGAYRPTVTGSSGTATPFGTPTSLTFSAGVASGSAAQMILYKIETANITATDGTITSGAGIPVTVSSNSWRLNWTALCPKLSATAPTCTSSVSVLDSFGNGYSGSPVNFTLTIDGGHYTVAVGAGTPGATATLPVTGSPSPAFTVTRNDNSGKTSTLSISGPAGFTPPGSMSLTS